MAEELLAVENLQKHFPVTRGIIFQKEVARVRAVDGVSFTIRKACSGFTNARCDARADISKQVNELKGLTLSTATVDGVKKNVQAIQDDLGKIKDAQGNLNADRKKQVQGANEAFTQQVKSIASSVGKSLSLSNAGTQLQTAVSQLAASYQQTLAKVDCS